ncbi:hypothetical protein EE612_047583 [Oryza sativa]|nr:hypothetical protein EE612_047583 [Oryza sativa]
MQPPPPPPHPAALLPLPLPLPFCLPAAPRVRGRRPCGARGALAAAARRRREQAAAAVQPGLSVGPAAAPGERRRRIGCGDWGRRWWRWRRRC